MRPNEFQRFQADFAELITKYRIDNYLLSFLITEDHPDGADAPTIGNVAPIPGVLSMQRTCTALIEAQLEGGMDALGKHCGLSVGAAAGAMKAMIEGVVGARVLARQKKRQAGGHPGFGSFGTSGGPATS